MGRAFLGPYQQSVGLGSFRASEKGNSSIVATGAVSIGAALYPLRTCSSERIAHGRGDMYGEAWQNHGIPVETSAALLGSASRLVSTCGIFIALKVQLRMVPDSSTTVFNAREYIR